ncbi:hypothetical protein GCM10009836_07330 [Pseudonocardia ailaonensis]|uniref:Uncharacterized protein n=1 Tax=Pseudonocardia ailaonensis TaxID=367279 RepID=A0ABN2MNF5_9PSEU
MVTTDTVPRRTATEVTARILIAVVTGSVAVALLVGGGALAWAQAALRGPDGYYTAAGLVATSSGHALVVDDLGLGYLGVRPPGGVDFRVSARSSGTGSVFVGLGPRAEVARYLAGVATDRITDVDPRAGSVDLLPTPGVRTPAPAAAQTFWVASAQGPGEQRVDWSGRPGDWSVVVMNADGRAGVDVLASGGIALPVLTPLAIGLLIGGLLVAGATVALVPSRRAQPASRGGQRE